MADTAPNHLNFGHVGFAAYYIEDSRWNFSRTPERRELRPLGPWQTVIAAAIEYPIKPPKAIRSARPAARRLTRDLPNLAPALGYLPALDIVSGAVVAATATYDATIGSLLAFGSITCEGHPEHRRPKRVVALPTGEVGNILRLQLLGSKRHGWHDDKAIYIQGPLITGGERVHWNQDATPIRQVCFAECDERRTFLAIRLPTRTLLFRPAYVHSGKAPIQSAFFEFAPATIAPYPILHVTSEDTGGTPHAHVTFNPDYQRQFAIVDERGNWSIWDINDGHANRNYSMACAAKGTIMSVENEPSASSTNTGAVTEDGWARIMWVGDANTIVVANRRHLAILNIKEGITPIACPPFVSKRSADWILDVKRHPKNRTHMFVLTSTRLFLVTVPKQSDGTFFNSNESGVAVLVSWAHFRGVEDITLQICLHACSEQDVGCIALLYSRLNALVAVYRFGPNPIGSAIPITSSDPIILDFEHFNVVSGSQRRIHQLHLDKFDLMGHATDRLEPGPMHLHDADFYQLTAISSDLSIHQIMLYAPVRGEVHAHLVIEPTSWVKNIRSRNCRENLSVHNSDTEDDFVQPDGSIVMGEPQWKLPYQPPKLLKRQHPGSWSRIYDYSSFYEAMIGAVTPPDFNEVINGESVDVSVVVEEVSRFLTGEIELIKLPLGTLLEFAGLKITVSDVDEVSTRLQELLHAQDHQTAQLQIIASSNALDLVDDSVQGEVAVSALYDTILRNWIAPLPADTPIRVRQNKERLARRIATEVILSCNRIRRRDQGHQRLTELQSRPEHDTTAPLTSISSQAYSTHASSQPDYFLPVSSPTSPLPPSSFGFVSDPLSRLSQHLRIEEPQSTSIPPSIGQVLTHWNIAADPSVYDWEATEQELDEELDPNYEESQKKREKAQRKKKRQEKRQKREDNIFESTILSKPHILRSSPGPILATELASSQIPASTQTQSQSQSQSQGQIFGGLLVHSQVEPGKHGGRPQMKKKKGKGRVSGF